MKILLTSLKFLDFLAFGGVWGDFSATLAERLDALLSRFKTFGALFFKDGKSVSLGYYLCFSELVFFRVPFYLTFTSPKVLVAFVQGQ